jgi:hypothetical protein
MGSVPHHPARTACVGLRCCLQSNAIDTHPSFFCNQPIFSMLDTGRSRSSTNDKNPLLILLNASEIFDAVKRNFVKDS